MIGEPERRLLRFGLAGLLVGATVAIARGVAENRCLVENPAPGQGTADGDGE